MKIPPDEEIIPQKASAEKLLELLDSYHQGDISRETFMAKVARLIDMEGPAPELQPATLDHLTIKVPDLERASHFYQDVLGMPLLRAEFDTHYLGVGNSFMGIQPSGSHPAYIDHFCLGLTHFDAAGIVAKLLHKGISIEGKAGVDSVRFIDPDGLTVQLSSTDYARTQTYQK